MSIETTGTGLKGIIAGISGLRVYAPNELPSAINELPAAVILPGEVLYDTDFSDNYDFALRVLILVAFADSPSAFNAIMDYIEPSGSKSVLAKVKADPTLGSTCDFARVVRNSGISTTDWAGINYLSTEFEIAVYA